MTDDTKAKIGFSVLILVLVLIFICGMGAGNDFSKPYVDDTWRDIIANKGCAEYYLDSKHQRQWRWK